jgi:hypothetical protein
LVFSSKSFVVSASLHAPNGNTVAVALFTTVVDMPHPRTIPATINAAASTPPLRPIAVAHFVMIFVNMTISAEPFSFVDGRHRDAIAVPM